MKKTIVLFSLSLTLLTAEAANDSVFFEKIKRLDLTSLHSLELNSEQSEFSKGMGMVVGGDFSGAKSAFTGLLAESEDSIIRERARDVLKSIYIYESKWDSLVNLGIPDDDENSVSLIKAYQLTGQESYSFPDGEEKVPVTLSITGTPILEVMVNGHKRRFWLDTGAGLSVLSSDAAQECGIVPLSAMEAQALTSTTKKVGIQPAVVNNLQIGRITIKNHPALIIDSKNLEFRVFGFKFMEIDGIIGWNAVQNFDIEIDYSKKRVTIKKPSTVGTRSRTLFWLDYPIVKASSGGTALYFFLDTGASGTGLYDNALSKLSLENTRRAVKIVGGAGGAERFETKKIPLLEFEINGKKIVLKNLTSYPERDAGFFKLDGILGADALKRKRVHIDIANGTFEID